MEHLTRPGCRRAAHPAVRGSRAAGAYRVDATLRPQVDDRGPGVQPVRPRLDRPRGRFDRRSRWQAWAVGLGRGGRAHGQAVERTVDGVGGEPSGRCQVVARPRRWFSRGPAPSASPTPRGMARPTHRRAGRTAPAGHLTSTNAPQPARIHVGFSCLLILPKVRCSTPSAVKVVRPPRGFASGAGAPP